MNGHSGVIHRTSIRPGSARITALVLLAALVRGSLLPAGEVLSTVVFVVSLGLILAKETGHRTAGERQWRTPASAVLGAAVGLLILVPSVGHGWSHRLFDHFWFWGGAIAVIATLEEAVIRGPLQRHWTEQAGPVAGVMASALIFSLIHLPAYGLAALPVDFAVGLSLAGLRMITGRILPCAVAHIIADWGAWFWS